MEMAWVALLKNEIEECPGGPVVNPLRFQCRGRGGFDSVQELRSHMPHSEAKRKKNEIFMVKGRHDIEQSFEKDFWSRVSLAYSKDMEKKPRRRQD